MGVPNPEIRRILDNHLRQSLPAMGLADTDVAWPNIAFDVSVGKLYLAPTCMFGEAKSASLGQDGINRVDGVYQISVFEILNRGMGKAEILAANLVNLYSGRTFIICESARLQITSAYSGTGIKQDGRFHIPVSVVWYCLASKAWLNNL